MINMKELTPGDPLVKECMSSQRNKVSDNIYGTDQGFVLQIYKSGKTKTYKDETGRKRKKYLTEGKMHRFLFETLEEAIKYRDSL